jgi:iron complex outermembrane receptor protein
MVRIGRVRAGLLAGGALVMIGAPTGARAQTAQATPPPAASTIDTIVVTAQRREQQANTVPISIQAFSGAQLKELHVTNVNDLSIVAPSFTVSKGYEGVPIYTLRGIGFNTINLSSTSTVGTYVDEVAYAYPFMNSGPIFDLQRVEVLKGPQGTLYGRNTTGGLIDFITNKPKDSFDAGLTAEVGDYATHNFEGYITGPLLQGLSGRLAFRTEDSDDGWQKSQSRPGDTLGQVHNYGVRGELAWRPNTRFQADLTLNGWRNTSDTLAAQAIGFTPATTGSPFNTPGLASYIATHVPTKDTQADWEADSAREADIGRGTGLHNPLQENDDFYAAALRLSYDLGGGLRLVSLSSYNHVRRDATYDWSGAPYEILTQQSFGHIGSLSEELHLEGDAGPAHWLVGGYYGHDNIDDADRIDLGQNANVGLIRFATTSLLATPFNSGGYTLADAATAFRTFIDFGDMTARTWSVFTNVDWTLTDQLSLTTGLRFTQDDERSIGCSRDYNGDMLANVNVTNRALYFQTYGDLVAPISEGQCVTFDPAVPGFAIGKTSLSEDNVAYRAALDWKPRPDLLAYASISRGAKNGTIPVNTANVSTQNLPAKQELLTAYELGLKAGLFERRVQANLALFYYDYDDKQLSVYFADPIYTALARLSNVPTADAYGFDGDVTWRITPQFTLTSSLTYVHTELGKYIGVNAAGQAQDYTGAAFPYSPQWQGAATLLFDRPINDRFGVQAVLNGRLQTDSHADLGDDPLFKIKPYGLLNGSVGVHTLDHKYELSVWGRNLTSTYYWSSVASNANTVVRFPGQPLTFGATLTAKY